MKHVKTLGQDSFENCFRILAISSLVGGHFVSQVLQWNTNAPDFNVSSNSSRLNVTVWSWLFGHTISKSNRSLMSPRSNGNSKPGWKAKMVRRIPVDPELLKTNVEKPNQLPSPHRPRAILKSDYHTKPKCVTLK